MPNLNEHDTLPTPTLGSLRQRRPWLGRQRALLPVIRELRRLIAECTRNRRVCSLTRLAVQADVDPHVVRRIMVGREVPRLDRLEAVARQFNLRLGLVPLEADS